MNLQYKKVLPMIRCMHRSRTVVVHVESNQIVRGTLRSPNSVEERLTDRAAQRGDLGMAGARRGVVDPRSCEPAT
jgi:hypothetical protein